MTFETYTDSFEPDSTAVEAAYYNAFDRTLAVVLAGGGAYLYRNFPQSKWSDFRNARSAGRYYALQVKPVHGPGEYLGFNADEDFERVNSPIPSNLSPVRVSGGTQTATEVRTYYGLGTPKALTLAPGVKVEGPVTFPLTSETPPERSKFTLHFTADGGNEVKTYTVESESTDAAIRSLYEVADMLDVVVTVKGVYIHFE